MNPMFLYKKDEFERVRQIIQAVEEQSPVRVRGRTALGICEGMPDAVGYMISFNAGRNVHKHRCMAIMDRKKDLIIKEQFFDQWTMSFDTSVNGQAPMVYSNIVPVRAIATYIIERLIAWVDEVEVAQRTKYLEG